MTHTTEQLQAMMFSDNPNIRAYAAAVFYTAEAARLKTLIDSNKAVLTANGSGQHVVTDNLGNTVTFTVSENNTYPEAALMDGLKPGQVQRITSRTLDRAKYRAAYPARWAAAKVTNGFKVIL